MTHPLSGWIPVNFNSKTGKFQRIKIEAKLELDHPFFNQSLENYASQHSNIQLTELAINDCLDFHDQIVPSGMIFHASRCGSTLVSQALQQLPGCTVLSEASAINAALQLRSNPKTLLRDIVSMLGQFHQREKLIVKHSSQNSLFLNKSIENYPEVPWVFVYRHPVEIMVSIERKSTAWSRTYQHTARAATLLGVEESAIENLSIEAYMALVLGKYFKGAFRTQSGNGLLVNHSNLSLSSINSVAQHFGISVTTEEQKNIQHTLSQYSKDPEKQRRYEPDVEQKKKDASIEIQKAAEEIMPLYEALEKKRLESSL